MNVFSGNSPAADPRARPNGDGSGLADNYGDSGPVLAPENGESALSRTVVMIWQHKWLLILCVLVFGAAAYFQARQLPRLYTAAATVVLDTQGRNSQVVDFDSVVPELSTDYQAMNTEMLFFKSPRLMQRVVEALNLQQYAEFNPLLAPPAEWHSMISFDGLVTSIKRLTEIEDAPPVFVEQTPEQIIAKATDILEEKVSVSIMQATYAFEISVTSQNAGRAAAIANTIVTMYIEHQREAKFDATRDATAWLSNRVLELKDELERKEAKVNDFAASAAAVQEETVLLNTQRLKAMRDRLQQQLQTARQARERLASIDAAWSDRDIQALATALDGFGDAQSLARGLAGQPNPDLDEVQPAVDRARQRLANEAEQADALATSMQPPLAELESSVRSQSNDLVALKQLRREAEATRLIYEYFLNRMQEISVQAGTQQADARLLAEAEPPNFASYPKIRATVMRAGVFGLMFGLALVFLRDAMRTSIRSAEELEALTGLPVIGVIPNAAERRPDGVVAEIVTKPTSGLAESVRNLRTAIQLSDFDSPPRVVMLTSSVPDEGKSVTAIALAQSAAMAGRKALLIDADLRRRRVKEYMRLPARAGLIALVSGRMSLEDVLVRDQQTGLDMILADRARITPTDLFESQRFQTILEGLQQTYDLIVLDTPPVLAVPDARVIARKADAVVYVVRWNRTNRRMVRTGLRLFQQVGIPVAGVALTRVNPKSMHQYGYYGYGSRGMKQYYGT